MHPSDTSRITGCKEFSYSGMEDFDAPVKYRKEVQRLFGAGSVGMKLVKKKGLDEM
jgi:hypothetical protein